MKYEKPQLAVSGSAVQAIQGRSAKGQSYADAAPLPQGLNVSISAYEADE